jgi:predicted NAD/FAD-dependent oxidoreductase
VRLANLAVVGAGIGGCSAAYFARKYLPGLNVTIYDARDRTGGRILTSNATGATLELGAAFFNGFNKTLIGIVEAEGLNFVPVEDRKDFAVWNGSEFVFRSNKQSFSTTLRLLAKYGRSLTRSFLLLRKVKEQVARLYREQPESPADIDEIFESTRLDEWHKKPFSEALLNRGISQAFIDEIVSPITRAIYSQNADLGGFAGISSLIGVYSGATYRLAEGNSALPARLVEAAKAIVKLGQKVDVIEKTSNGTYGVYAGEDVTVFDSVIIATPLELAAIRFDGLSVQDWLPQTYQAVYKSVMRGVFDPEYFGLENSADPPATVLTTKDSGPITQYSIHKARDGQSLVTISSPKPLNHNAFNGLFKDEGVRVLGHCWKAAYPVFRPLTRLPPTCIGERLMYINAIESAVSSMETSALSALNAVRMLD